MEIFKGQNLIEFSARFKTEKDCKRYSAEMKWKDGYSCRKCGHIKYQEVKVLKVLKDVSRCCSICSHIESPTANTLFHKLKFGLQKAFFICFEMSY